MPTRRPIARVLFAAPLLAVLAFATAPGASGPIAQEPAAPALVERATALLETVPLIDGHNDLPWAMRAASFYDFDAVDIRQPQPKLQTDIPRLRAGRLGAQFWSVYVPARLAGEQAVVATLEQVAAVREMQRRYPDTFEAATTADDVERIFKAGRIASLMGIEGGHSIGGSLGALRAFHALGVGYMTLTHSDNVEWADAATDAPKLGGLSAFGEDVVREMNWLGMLVDLSHVSPDTMDDALRLSAAPVIFSHSSARAVCDVSRNVPDDILRRLVGNGGVVMVTFVPGFVSPETAKAEGDFWSELRRLQKEGLDEAAIRKHFEERMRTSPPPPATLAQVADHIDHIRKVAGIDHIGIGSDFDGIDRGPVGLEDVSKYPALFAELLRRGYSDEDVKKIAGLNLLRVMRQAEQVAARLQKERGPSTARPPQAKPAR
ncbi:MAG: dipeptidase [Vicinamibacteraceae bacterium]|nr:dipeptidase [Vicinamibacteraceae bacterium]